MDLQILNSMTKYPSIPTYHEMGDKGKLQDSAFSMQGPFEVTEKIDGTNARIVLFEDDWFLGSREELLYAKEDRIGNPALGIVENLKSIASDFSFYHFSVPGYIYVIYGELFGGKTSSKAKNYGLICGYRVFDVAAYPLELYQKFQVDGVRTISGWRENVARSHFLSTNDMEDFLNGAIAIVPHLEIIEDLPVTIKDTYDFLRDTISETFCKLDETAKGKPEGVVVKTLDHRYAAKIRFQDYERAIKRLG
jgi:hypothetical protein